MTIARDSDVLGGEPRLAETRIGVRHIAGRVIDLNQTPAVVADQLDISLAAVYEALSYYYANIDEMRDVEQDAERAFDHVETESLQPKERVK